MKKPVIIDCDPGYDDTLALILAFGSKELDIKAVTTCAGNQTQEKIINNALKILSFIKEDTVVAKGAMKPLIRDLVVASEVHGESGLGGLYLPEPTLKASSKHAVEVMVDIINASEEKVTLIPTAPLTNIALLLSTYPEVKNKIERISLMGGACFSGNVTPAAEFNIKIDPEAADIVFKSGVPITMCGLDVTHKALFLNEDTEKFRKIGNKTGNLVAELMDNYSVFYRENTEFAGSPIHDACAVAYVLDPSIFETQKCYVAVETKGELTLGETVVDYRNILKKEKNAEVAFEIDREALVKMMCDAIRRLP
jgi:pyrimidine-specific ribonucleoside hydrolase